MCVCVHQLSYVDNKDGTISVSFLPTEAGDYSVSVRFGDKHITGSPFVCNVEGDTKKRNQISISSSSQVTLPGVLTDDDLRSLNAIILTPSGLEEPCFLKRLPSGNIGVSFTPREIGDHVVSVKRMGKQIKNSPFKIVVTEKEVGDAKKVKVDGDALNEGKTHTDNFFTIDTSSAGYGGLSLSIEGTYNWAGTHALNTRYIHVVKHRMIAQVQARRKSSAPIKPTARYRFPTSPRSRAIMC